MTKKERNDNWPPAAGCNSWTRCKRARVCVCVWFLQCADARNFATQPFRSQPGGKQLRVGSFCLSEKNRRASATMELGGQLNCLSAGRVKASKREGERKDDELSPVAI